MEKKIFEIGETEEGIFLERPNRFLAKVRLKSKEEVLVHVHDSGRIKELLYKGNVVKIRKAKNIQKRKTKWDLVSAKAIDGEEILLNSSFHRYISENILKDEKISPFGKIDYLKAEVKHGHSRIDYLINKQGQKIWVEVKGVSLGENKKAIFPDAPSIRAVKHLETLMEIIEESKKKERACIFLLVFVDANIFLPNDKTDKLFTEKFYQGMDRGIEVIVIQLKIKNNWIYYTDKKIKIKKREKNE